MFYKITEKDIRVDNPEIERIPEYRSFSSDELKAIFEYADFDSPYYLMEQSKRQTRVLTIYKVKKKDFFEQEVVKNAIDLFRDFLGDPKKEMLEVINSTMAEVVKKLNEPDLSEDSLKSLKLKLELISKLPATVTTMKQLEGIVNGVVKEERKERTLRDAVRDE